MSRHEGFTLIEALVAMSILAFVVVGFLGTRTAALTDATEARNWRLARELAEEEMSRLMAGAHELPPETGRIDPFEKYPGFALQILIGESAIASHEQHQAGQLDNGMLGDNSDRLIWQQDRENLRSASQRGMSYLEYEQFLLEEELRKEQEEQIPSEVDLEDVMVVIYFPVVRFNDDRDQDTFTLKAKVSTLALECMTPEVAERFAESRGGEMQAGNRPPGATGSGDEGGIRR
jgi:prepilin-type N-terminal cleavage/methylation domain-containing protein